MKSKNCAKCKFCDESFFFFSLFHTYHLNKVMQKQGDSCKTPMEVMSFLLLLLQQKCGRATSLDYLLPMQLVRRTRQSRNTSSLFSMVVVSLSWWSFLCTQVRTRHRARGGQFSFSHFSSCPPSPVTQTSGTYRLRFLVRNVNQHAQRVAVSYDVLTLFLKGLFCCDIFLVATWPWKSISEIILSLRIINYSWEKNSCDSLYLCCPLDGNENSPEKFMTDALCSVNRPCTQ